MNQETLQAARRAQASLATFGVRLAGMQFAAARATQSARRLAEALALPPYALPPRGIIARLRYADAWVAYRLAVLARRAGLKI